MPRSFQREVATSWPHVMQRVTRLLLRGALASFFVVAAAWVILQHMMCSCEPKLDLALQVAKSYAFDAYPAWAAEHPSQSYPSTLRELDEYMRDENGRDPWGTPYCFTFGTYGIRIISAGEDARFATADDIRSDQ